MDEKLGLEPHPQVGYFRQTYKAELTVDRAVLPSLFAGSRAVTTAIYFLLGGENFSAFHRRRSDEMWHFKRNPYERVSLLESGATEMFERAAFLICGVMTVLIGRVYGNLQRFAPTNAISWSPFSVVFFIVGIAGICIALLPRAWVRGIRSERSERRPSIPFRFLLAFAAAGLLLVIILSFIPHRSFDVPMGIVYSICPACVLTITVDPSLTAVILVLAPLNALVFGAIGGVIGTVVSLLPR